MDDTKLLYYSVEVPRPLLSGVKCYRTTGSIRRESLRGSGPYSLKYDYVGVIGPQFVTTPSTYPEISEDVASSTDVGAWFSFNNHVLVMNISRLSFEVQFCSKAVSTGGSSDAVSGINLFVFVRKIKRKGASSSKNFDVVSELLVKSTFVTEDYSSEVVFDEPLSVSLAADETVVCCLAYSMFDSQLTPAEYENLGVTVNYDFDVSVSLV